VNEQISSVVNSARQKFALAVLLVLFCGKASFSQFYYGLQTDFGKNRIQYEEFLWQFYRFEKFDTYFYLGGKDIAIFTAQKAQESLKEIEDLLDYTLDDNIQFIIYNKQSDFRQSNIGLVTDQQYNIGGVTRIAGSKIAVYYEGDHQKLEEQIRAGIAEILINQMMYGGNWKDMLKNSTLLTLPEWYVKGLMSYLANPWSAGIENRVKDGIMSGRYKKFNRLTGEDAVYAGHSIWKYVIDNYGKSVVPNILYMTRVSRNIESGYLFVLGVSLRNLSKEWMAYYTRSFELDEEQRTLPKQPALVKKPKVNRVYGQFKISPDGKYAVYTTNELCQHKLWLHDFEKNKTKRILKSGHKLDRINDYSYPLIAWHPTSELFSFIIEKKGNVVLSLYTIESGKIDERAPLYDFEKILDFAYSHDGKKYVMSAVQNGQTDIFVFNVASSTIEPVTKDFYDDLNPRFINKSTEIVFSSNRTNDTLRAEAQDVRKKVSPTKDIFKYQYSTKSNILRRVTNTPDANEIQPVEYDKKHIAFLSDQNGVYNRYVGRLDSAISFVDTIAHYRYFTNVIPVTNYSRGIIEHDIQSQSNRYTEVIFHKGRYRLFSSELAPSASLGGVFIENSNFKGDMTKVVTPQTGDKKTAADPETITKTIKVFNQDTPKGKELDINNYVFEGETTKVKKDTIAKPAASDTIVKYQIKEEKADEFVLPKQRTYIKTFLPDQLISQFDNSFLNANYQKFTGGGALYFNPGFSGLFKLGASDVFENYRIVAGLRLAGNFDSNEYLLSFDDRSKRLDKQLVLHRQAFRSPGFLEVPKVHSHTLKYSLRYPFNEVASLRGSLSIRNDRNVFLSSDLQNLKKPNEFDNWAIGKIEYIFDNTLNKGLNLYNGTRYKLFAEYFNQIDQRETNILIVGLDFRHYLKIHRDLIWANRLAASTSMGSQKLIYYLGSVDNWMNFGKHPTFNYDIPIDSTQKYAYQTLATNMRGFSQNIRNGNSFAVLNSELRWPIVKYLVNRPLRSDFLNNFQIIGFGDIGSAWTGTTPYSKDNSFNTQIVRNGPLTIVLKSQREPIVAGYGFGLRSRLWGYFVRADWAWGIDDAIVQPSIFYLSLSLDF